jgi:hypothetical protein
VAGRKALTFTGTSGSGLKLVDIDPS